MGLIRGLGFRFLGIRGLGFMCLGLRVRFYRGRFELFAKNATFNSYRTLIKP